MTKRFVVDGRNIEAKLLGNGRTTVLFFHGFGSSAEAIPFDEALLAQHNLQLLCFNRPGMGGSDLRKRYIVEDTAADAQALLKESTIQQCVVAGWSAGGLFAQAFAQMYPENVLSLHLISSAIPVALNDAAKTLPRRWKSLVFLNRYFPLLAKMLFRNVSKKAQKNPGKLMQQSMDDMTPADKEVAGDKRFYPLLQQAAVEGFANKGQGVLLEAKALGKAKIAYSKITCPVHIWTGEQDAIWPLSTARFLHNQLPQAELHIFRNAGHLLYLKEWKKLVAAFAQCKAE